MRTPNAITRFAFIVTLLLSAARFAGAQIDGPPVVHIVTPGDEDTVAAESPITFAASIVTLVDQGDDLVWTSSIDGVIGHGASVTRTLSPGTHRIRAEVTGGGGRQGSETVMLTVVPSSLRL